MHRDAVHLYTWLNAVPTLRSRHTADEIEFLLDECTLNVGDARSRGRHRGFCEELMSWAVGVLENRYMLVEVTVRFLLDGDDGRIFACGARVRNEGHATHGIERSGAMLIKSAFPQGREVERTVAVASMFQNIAPEIVRFDGARGILVQRDAGKLTHESFDIDSAPCYICRVL